MRRALLSLLLLLPLVVASCDDDDNNAFNNQNNNPPNNIQNNHTNPGCGAVTNEACDPFGDEDNDFISNGHEGCQCDLDKDMDTIPNYIDYDSDGDGVSDVHEAGDDDLNTPPVDTDEDGIPDYLDSDSDNDGVTDGDEDRNNDGKLGNCEEDPILCDGSCTDPESYCHPVLEICINAICLNGETDPHSADTDGDGIPDGEESTFICNATTEEHEGRRPVQYRNHSTNAFRIAIEKDSSFQEMNPSDANLVEAAAGFDLTTQEHAHAGFVLSRSPSDPQLYVEVNQIIAALGDLGDVVTLSAGNANMSHAEKPQIINVLLRLTISSPVDHGIMRNRILAKILGRELSAFPLPINSPFTSSSTTWAVTFMVQKNSGSQTLVMGAVAPFADWDSKEWIRFHLEDASGGACIANLGDTAENECEQYMADVPVADIVWVVDDSGSMSDDQIKLANASQTFLSVASTLGLNWRMCVVDMTEDNDGSCCTDTNQSGDTWLSAGVPGDDERFRNCIQDPAGSQTADGGHEYGLTQMEAAVNRHSPAQQDSTTYFRPTAAKIVFFLTDEVANEVDQHDLCPNVPGPNDCHFFSGCFEGDIFGCNSVLSNVSLMMECQGYPDMWNHSQCDEVYRCMGAMNDEAWDPLLCGPLVDPYVNFARDNQLIAYGLAVLSTDDPEQCSEDPENSSGTSAPHGYQELIQSTGGILASMCQDDFTTTMELMIEDMAGAASPIILAHTPIPVSLAVAMERKDPADPLTITYEPLYRSSTNGFLYKASSNRIVLVGQPMEYPPYEVVVSYTRWVTTMVPPD